MKKESGRNRYSRKPIATHDNWHFIGIATDQLFMKVFPSYDDVFGYNINSSTSLEECLEYDYIPFYVEVTKKIPAREAWYLTYDLYWTEFLGRAVNDDDYTQYESYHNYNVWVRDEDKEPENTYELLETFLERKVDYMIVDELGRFPTNTLVPVKHWPEMLFTDKHFKDIPIIEYVEGGPEAPYPELGYYPPKREIKEDPYISGNGWQNLLNEYVGTFSWHFPLHYYGRFGQWLKELVSAA